MPEFVGLRYIQEEEARFGVGVEFKEQDTYPAIVEFLTPNLSASRSMAINPGDHLLRIGDDHVLDRTRANSLLQGKQGSLVKLLLRRGDTLSEYECVLMRGGSEYLDLFDAWQSAKQLADDHHRVLSDAEKVISRLKESEATMLKQSARIKTLEAENSKFKKEAEQLKRSVTKVGPWKQSVATNLNKIKSELKDLEKGLKELVTINTTGLAAAKPSPAPSPSTSWTAALFGARPNPPIQPAAPGPAYPGPAGAVPGDWRYQSNQPRPVLARPGAAAAPAPPPGHPPPPPGGNPPPPPAHGPPSLPARAPGAGGFPAPAAGASGGFPAPAAGASAGFPAPAPGAAAAYSSLPSPPRYGAPPAPAPPAPPTASTMLASGAVGSMRPGDRDRLLDKARGELAEAESKREAAERRAAEAERHGQELEWDLQRAREDWKAAWQDAQAARVALEQLRAAPEQALRAAQQAAAAEATGKADAEAAARIAQDARIKGMEAELETLKVKVVPTLSARLKAEQEQHADMARRLEEAEANAAKKRGCLC